MLYYVWIEFYYPSEFIIYKENNTQRLGRIWSIISIDNELKIKVQRIYVYNELPVNFHCNDWYTTRELQLWLVDQYLKEGNIIIAIDEVIEKINISIIRDTDNTTNGLYIKEILYKNNDY